MHSPAARPGREPSARASRACACPCRAPNASSAPPHPSAQRPLAQHAQPVHPRAPRAYAPARPALCSMGSSPFQVLHLLFFSFFTLFFFIHFFLIYATGKSQKKKFIYLFIIYIFFHFPVHPNKFIKIYFYSSFFFHFPVASLLPLHFIPLQVNFNCEILVIFLVQKLE